ncbi:MAG: protein of unknown function DUF3383 [Caudoviricetes sp.]|nr:MAG: protein of unknown function DUF3383 [Caudoviricetes sp.]
MSAAINLNKLINIRGGVTNTSINPAVCAGLFLTTNDIMPNNGVDNVKQFANLEAVGNYFGTSSTEYSLANNYFLNANNIPATAPYILFAKYIDANLAPYIRGGQKYGSAALAALQAINAGAMGVIFDGITTSISAVDLTAAASFSAVAAAIEAKLIAAGLADATVTYSSVTKAFTISNGVITGTSTVDYSPVSPLATALGVTQASGAVLSQGSVALTVAENLDSYLLIAKNWKNFTTVFVPDEQFIVDACAWLNTADNTRCYVFGIVDANLLIPDNTSNIAYTLLNEGYATEGTDGKIKYSVAIMPNYGESDIASFLMGIAGAVDYTRANATVSYAYKAQTGLGNIITDDTSYDALVQKGFNSYGRYNSSFNSFDFTEDGSVGGVFLWFDFHNNQFWLVNTIQDSLAAFFAEALIVPNDSDGYSQVMGVLTGVANQGLKNRVITPGETFDPATIAVLKQQSGGIDVAAFLTQSGYYIQIVTPTPTQRANRDPLPFTFWYASAGAINKISGFVDLVI